MTDSFPEGSVSATPEADWHYVAVTGRGGPLTLDQLRELIGTDTIDRRTMVWRPGWKDWRQLCDVDALWRPPSLPSTAVLATTTLDRGQPHAPSRSSHGFVRSSTPTALSEASTLLDGARVALGLFAFSFAALPAIFFSEGFASSGYIIGCMLVFVAVALSRPRTRSVVLNLGVGLPTAWIGHAVLSAVFLFPVGLTLRGTTIDLDAAISLVASYPILFLATSLSSLYRTRRVQRTVDIKYGYGPSADKRPVGLRRVLNRWELRSGPDQGESVLGEVQPGHHVHVIETRDRWCLVLEPHTAMAGWVLENALDSQSLGPALVPPHDNLEILSCIPGAPDYSFVRWEVVKLRQSPAPTARIVARLALGQRVFAAARHGEWTQVVALPDDVIGWLLSGALEPDTTPQTPTVDSRFAEGSDRHGGEARTQKVVRVRD